MRVQKARGIEMSNGGFNSEQIALKVRDYFEKVRGMKAHFFNIDECSYDGAGGVWTVVCRFVSNPFDGREDRYKVKVDGKAGDIIEVARLAEKV